MIRLALPIFVMAATSLMGIGVIAVLSAGYDTLMPILYGAGAGFIIAIPGTWIIVKKISSSR